MKTKVIGAKHGAKLRSNILRVRRTAGDIAHRAIYTVGSGVDSVAGAVTDVGFGIAGYVRGFVVGLLRTGPTGPNA